MTTFGGAINAAHPTIMEIPQTSSMATDDDIDETDNDSIGDAITPHENSLNLMDKQSSGNDIDSVNEDKKEENTETPITPAAPTHKPGVLSFYGLFGKGLRSPHQNGTLNKPLILPSLPKNIDIFSPVKEGKDLQECVLVIYNNFVSETGTYEINISSHVRNTLHELIKYRGQFGNDHNHPHHNGNGNGNGNVSVDVFDLAAKEILNLCKQSFNRFSRTEEFHVFSHNLMKYRKKMRNKKKGPTLKNTLSKLKAAKVNENSVSSNFSAKH